MQNRHPLNFQLDRPHRSGGSLRFSGIAPNVAPTVSITAPANNASYVAPASIALTATATDSDGTITQVAFYDGTTLLGNATQQGSTSTYIFNWSNVAQGSYTLTAVATDNSTATTVSSVVQVTVTAHVVQIYYIHTDQLDTPRLITDSTNTPVWKWDSTDPFANNPVNDDPNATGNHFTFNQRLPGQYFDKETNTYYNYFRDYDPELGTYRQSDPIGLGGGINTYSYVGGNPLRYNDPLGLFGYSSGTGVTTTAIVGWGVTGGTNGQFFSDGSANTYGVKGTGWGADVSADAQVNGALYFGSGSGGASSWEGDFTAINVGVFGLVGSFFWGGGWFGVSGGAGVAPEGVKFGATVTHTTYVPIVPRPNPPASTNSCK